MVGIISGKLMAFKKPFCWSLLKNRSLVAFNKAVSNKVSNYMATLKAIPRRQSVMSRSLKSCTILRIL